MSHSTNQQGIAPAPGQAPAKRGGVVQVTLISTYDLGRQPFAIASAAAWLKRAGAEVQCFDLAVQPMDGEMFPYADLVAISVPMHTATRLATGLIGKIRERNPKAHICFFGLYAPLNGDYLRKVGVDTILGGEFEEGLATLLKSLGSQQRQKQRQGEGPGSSIPEISLRRQRFLVPDRSQLPPLERYAKLCVAPGEYRRVGYTEASRGCKHLCRHCPIVPVYDGTFRIVQADVVLQDIRQQVAGGAAHITFGDPDFFNGPKHGLAIAAALHEEFPDVTYDVTIKVEHLLRHGDRLAELRQTGCLFVTSAFESFDDRILAILRKQHTRADIFQAVKLLRGSGLRLNPTFVPFSPWITLAGYQDFLAAIVELQLMDDIAPVQYGIRLLFTASSRLMELAETRAMVGEFDEKNLVYRWNHPDPRVDRLGAAILRAVQQGQLENENRREIFGRILARSEEAGRGETDTRLKAAKFDRALPAVFVPHLTEPWYC